MSFPASAGLQLDQAPPLSIPASFFALVPVACVVAGALLASPGSTALSTPGTPGSLAATHVLTLGLLGAAMFGALYQLLPVVLGVPVPVVGLARGVAVALTLGTAALVFGFAETHPLTLKAGAALLGLAVVLLLGPVTAAIARSRGGGVTTAGMAVAVAALATLAALGITLSLVRSGTISLPGEAANWRAWRLAHLGVALLAWVGALLPAVSWKIIPMFYLADPVPRGFQGAVVAGAAASLVALPAVVFCGGGVSAVLLAAAPGALAAWIVHPLVSLRSIRRRRRKRRDASLRAWQLGLSTALLLPVAVALAILRPEPRFDVLVGWLALWGWAGLIIHGMLSRILSFLVWFHRFSALAGLADVPSMRGLLPDRRVGIGVLIHAGTLVAGVLAVLLANDWLARLTGLGMIATGLWMGAWMISVLTRTAAAPGE